MKTDVTAAFAVQVGSDSFVDEAGLAALDPAVLRGRDPLFGAVTVRAGGQPDAVLHDDLEALVGNLFQAIPALRAGERFTAWYSDTPGEYVLEPAGGGLVRLTGTVIPAFEAPAADLLPALHACGVRFLDFVRTALAAERDFQLRLPDLDDWAAVAARALPG